MSEAFELANPDRVTVGTVGPVGERMFLLQVREGPTLMTLKLEKAQVSALARFLDRMLGELERPVGLPSGDELALEPFEEPDFVVRSLGVTYDEDSDRIILVADEVDRTEADEEREALFGFTDDLEPEAESGGSVRLTMTRGQAAALAIRGTELVEAGRPPCPLCGYPLDARGHVCPRTNGNRPPLT
ncbi:MAG TPA: DUF3090 family protein [Acidimicrobiales bacterium]|nr:DUF3090 family protein [Acidimicrobiales bacterium]